MHRFATLHIVQRAAVGDASSVMTILAQRATGANSPTCWSALRSFASRPHC